jgi:hypothetical protein
MATIQALRTHNDSFDILLDKISQMREELLTIERTLERLQREEVELTPRRDGRDRAL